jgi:hypothetical protein
MVAIGCVGVAGIGGLGGKSGSDFENCARAHLEDGMIAGVSTGQPE